MRIWLLSDLHLEVNGEREISVPAADVAVVAGDLHSPVGAGVEWLAEQVAPAMPVVYVAGNHEFYGDSYTGGLERGLEAARRHPDVHLLHNSSVVIGSVRFLGGTLWTDYALRAGHPPDREKVIRSMGLAGRLMPDHRAISLDDDRPDAWRPLHAAMQHQKTRAYLEKALAERFQGPTVVVTHHAPHPGSISPLYADDPLNAAFVSDLGPLIRRFAPNLWVHGHVHSSCANMIAGKTQVLCNPLGYGSENPAFDPAMIVEV